VTSWLRLAVVCAVFAVVNVAAVRVLAWGVMEMLGTLSQRIPPVLFFGIGLAGVLWTMVGLGLDRWKGPVHRLWFAPALAVFPCLTLGLLAVSDASWATAGNVQALVGFNWSGLGEVVLSWVIIHAVATEKRQAVDDMGRRLLQVIVPLGVFAHAVELGFQLIVPGLLLELVFWFLPVYAYFHPERGLWRSVVARPIGTLARSVGIAFGLWFLYWGMGVAVVFLVGGTDGLLAMVFLNEGPVLGQWAYDLLSTMGVFVGTASVAWIFIPGGVLDEPEAKTPDLSNPWSS